MEKDGRIGILGGTFNPVHYGHLRVAEEAAEILGLGEVIFIPSGNPPLKGAGLAPSHHRYELTRIAIRDNPRFRISDIECGQEGKSYTVDTIAALRDIFPGRSFSFILGIDSFFEIPYWKHPEKLMSLTDFAVVSRPGFSFVSLSSLLPVDRMTLAALDSGSLNEYRTCLDSGREIVLLAVTPLQISATTIRSLVRQRRSIRYLLPQDVESYIITQGLFSEGSEYL